ncbi:MAG: DUF5655 domain-containing protein [Clostridia bacterium]|nr:DUF5655 domain-containing protein [Clostridia bacterium]
MADIKLFKIGNVIDQLASSSVVLERELQVIIEKNMQIFFGVHFLASEYVINGGRIDSIGIDENNCPVIFEYKRSLNENVINQGLFYLNWLLEHKADYKLLVLEQFGKEIANKIDWSMPRVICIAGDFNKYDEEAIKQINRNISLIRYKKFGAELLLFELLNTNTVKPLQINEDAPEVKNYNQKTFADQLKQTSESIRQLYVNIKDYILSLGDDISENELKFYVAFKKIKNIATVQIYAKHIIICLSLNPEDVQIEDGFTRNVKEIGHLGTGDLEIRVTNEKDFERAKSLIEKAYKEN